MSIFASFNALETPDVASIQFGGTHYRLYVWCNRFYGGTALTAIEGSLRAVLPGGEEQELSRQTYMISSNPATVFMDSPKVIGCANAGGGVFFVIHWMEISGGGAVIWKAHIDPSISLGVVNDGSLATNRSAANYDVQPVHGTGGVGYVLVHRQDLNNFATYRFLVPNAGWAGFTWTVADTVDSADTLLCIHAEQNTDAVCWAWERSSLGPAPFTVQARRRVLSTGVAAGAAWNVLSGAVADRDARYFQGGWTKRTSTQWTLAVEGRTVDGGGVAERHTFVVWQSQSLAGGIGAEGGGTGRAWHLRLLSRPWARQVGGSTTLRQVQAICGFSEVRTAISPRDFDQSAAFVVELPHAEDDFGDGDRALPKGSIGVGGGIVDARESNGHPITVYAGMDPYGRRVNHVSSLALPNHSGVAGGHTTDVHAYTAALCVYVKMMVVNQQGPSPAVADPVLMPQQTSVVGYTVYDAEPWHYYGDEDDIPIGNPTVNFHGPFAWHPQQPAAVADTLVLAGGMPQIYDGSQISEIGWTWAPEILEVVLGANDATYGLIPDTTYFFAAVFEQTDDVGHVHRSAPSTPIEYHVPAGGGPKRLISVRVLTNTLSRRFDRLVSNPRRAHIVLYRADEDGQIFYRVHGKLTNDVNSGYTQTPFNNPDVETVDISGGNDDATNLDFQITRHEPMPWQYIDGVFTPLTPTMPPAASVAGVWKNRLWLLTDEGHLWYSKEIAPGSGSSAVSAPEFASANVFRLDGESFLGTGLLGMDAHMIVWGADAIYALSGDPNDDNGFGSTLTLTLVHRGVGCIDQRSIVRTGEGVFFQSDRGIEFMSRGWDLSNVSIGSMVENDVRTAGNIRAATWIEEKQQVRFTVNGPPTQNKGGTIYAEPWVLVWDYFHECWTKFTLPEGDVDSIRAGNPYLSQPADGLAWKGVGETLHCMLQMGALYIEREFTDANIHADQIITGGSGQSTNTLAYNAIDIQTGWISFAGIAGLQRVWDVILSTSGAASADDPDLQVDLDFEQSSGNYTAPPASQTITRVAPYNGAVRVRPRVTKLSGLRMRLRRAGTFTLLPDWNIVSATLKVGLKKGLKRVPSTQNAS